MPPALLATRRATAADDDGDDDGSKTWFRIEPRSDWVQTLEPYAGLNFPTLYYRRVAHIDTPMVRTNSSRWLYGIEPEQLGPDLVHGGSLNVFQDLPLHAERRAIFERLLFPYHELPEASRFRPANGLLLWPLVQLHCYTQVSSPQRVFIAERSMDQSSGWAGAFHFQPGHIELIERDASLKPIAAPVERPPPLPFVTR